MAKSRRANAVVFGFDFQVNAAIVLMIENIEDLKSLRLEGNYEDIEIELENNQYILAQAKAVERSSSDFRNVRKNLEKSLISLSEGNQKVDAQRLILITNSPNPLNEEASRSIFWGDAHREFLSLPESSQELIRRYLDNINQPLDTDKFMIQRILRKEAFAASTSKDLSVITDPADETSPQKISFAEISIPIKQESVRNGLHPAIILRKGPVSVEISNSVSAELLSRIGDIFHAE